MGLPLISANAVSIQMTPLETSQWNLDGPGTEVFRRALAAQLCQTSKDNAWNGLIQVIDSTGTVINAWVPV